MAFAFLVIPLKVFLSSRSVSIQSFVLCLILVFFMVGIGAKTNGITVSSTKEGGWFLRHPPVLPYEPTNNPDEIITMIP